MLGQRYGEAPKSLSAVIDGLGVRTAILYERFTAGEDLSELARDHAAPTEAIENAIRCELRAA